MSEPINESERSGVSLPKEEKDPKISNGDLENSEQKFIDTNFCRDYHRGSCRRGSICKFSHENDYSLLSKRTVIFCHDFQNKTCTWIHCKFIHCTTAEESHYLKTGELPICKDFFNDNCKKGTECQSRHVKGDPSMVTTLTGTLSTSVDPMTLPPPPKGPITSPWPASLHEPPPGYGVLHDQILNFSMEKIKTMPPPPPPTTATPTLIVYYYNKQPVPVNLNSKTELRRKYDCIGNGAGEFYNEEVKKAKYSDNANAILDCKFCIARKQVLENSLEKLKEALALKDMLIREEGRLNLKVDEMVSKISEAKSNLEKMINDGQPMFNNSGIRYSNAVLMQDMLPISSNQLSNSSTVSLNRTPTMMYNSSVDVNSFFPSNMS